METRICSKCNIEKDITEFSKAKTNKDGIRKLCKDCCKKYQKQWKENKKEETKEQNKLYRESHKEERKQYLDKNKEALKEKGKQYRKTHYYKPNKETQKRYYEKNKEAIKEYSRKYREEHYDIYKMHRQKRKAKKKQLPSTLTAEQWNKCKQYFNNRCAYCGKELPLEQEHFVALSRGGEYTHNNIIPACKGCNNNKRARTFEEWYLTYKYYDRGRERKILKYLGYKDKTQQLTM